jgi:hypothetical protein
MTAQEIRRAIRDKKAEMKARGFKVTSFMNRQPVEQGRCNEELYRLKLLLEQVTADTKR